MPPEQPVNDSGSENADVEVAPRPPLNAALAATLFLVAVLAGTFGLMQYFGHAHVDLVALQMAGSPSRANCVVNPPTPTDPSCAAGVARAPGAASAPSGRAHQFRSALRWDFWLIAGYATALAIGNYLGWRVSWTRRFNLAARAGMCLVGAAVALNLTQDALLLGVLRHQPMHGPWSFRVIQALAFAKFCALLVGAATGICSLATTAGRLLHARRDRERRWPEVIAPPPLERPTRAEFQMGARQAPASGRDEQWDRMANVPHDRLPAEMGICVSGGGVRSATVTLGALQSLRSHGQLEQASYLVSVSGGGYMAGAFQLALTDPGAPGGGSALDAPRDVFLPGSVEEDHVRRHSSYLADSPRQWVQALAVLLRGLLGSLALLGLAVAVIGIAIGRFYRATRIADLSGLRPLFLQGPCAGGTTCHPLAPFPTPPLGVNLVIGAVAAMAVIAYLIPLSLQLPDRLVTGAWRTGSVLLGSATALAILAVGLPASVWASVWLTYHVGHANQGQVVSAGAVTASLTYAASLAAILWRNKKPIANTVGGVRSIAAKGQVLPNSMVQCIMLWVSMVVLCVALLSASGWVASSGWIQTRWALLPIAMLGLAGVLLDQTWLSLHPFYRRRLATAFAVRRTIRGGRPVAEPYDPSVRTRLSEYAKPHPHQPKVIFAAAANIDGEELGPPGRSVVSFTMASDYVGGAQVGWIPTAKLEQLLGDQIARDLTVEGAVAISGAAFASAMGRQTRFYELFLCLSNARLGAWLPNPRFVWLKQAHAGDWTFPGLPSRRRLNYLGREIFGIHPCTSPLLLCTDGGHYENLGLVELLRHKCRVIYCIDATGDSPPLATTFAQAITLAREELGVEIIPRDPVNLVPGAAAPLTPPLAELGARLSPGAVCVADITLSRRGQVPRRQRGLRHDKPVRDPDRGQGDPHARCPLPAPVVRAAGQGVSPRQHGRPVVQR